MWGLWRRKSTVEAEPVGRWVRDEKRSSVDSFNEIVNLDGVPWHEAPNPPRLHLCTPQTKAWLGFRYVERCACGGVRMDRDSAWIENNQNRRNRK